MNKHTPSGIVTRCTYGKITPDRLYDNILKAFKMVKIYILIKQHIHLIKHVQQWQPQSLRKKSLHPFGFWPLNEILTRSVATWGGTSIKLINY